jgi:hypothetical protein
MVGSTCWNRLGAWQRAPSCVPRCRRKSLRYQTEPGPSPFSTANPSRQEILFAPPALCECGHCGLATLSIAVCGRAAFMVREDQRPHPRRPYRRCIGVEDAADSFAIGQHVVILFVPLARGPAGRCAFEDEVVLVHPSILFRSEQISEWYRACFWALIHRIGIARGWPSSGMGWGTLDFACGTTA